MRIIVVTSIEATEILVELADLIGSSPHLTASRLLNSQLEALAILRETEGLKLKRKKEQKEAMEYLKANQDDKTFMDCVEHYSNDPALSGYFIVDQCRKMNAATQPQADPDSQVPDPLLEPQQDLAKLDEESRWDYDASLNRRNDEGY